MVTSKFPRAFLVRLMFALALASLARPLNAQAQSEALSAESPGGNQANPPQQDTSARICGFNSFRQCFKDFLHDQTGIWTSPARVRSKDLLWLLPFGAATGTAIVTDSNAMDGLKSHTTLAHNSRIFSETGNPAVTVGVSMLLFGIGAGKHNDTLRETGVLSTEAIADTAVVIVALKMATNRERPYAGTGFGKFWPNGSSYPAGFSMPSMHVAGSWAMARVIDAEYPHRPWLKIALYGWAAAVSATRVTGQKHFPSDVIVGGTVGYLIGGYVVRQHAAAYRDQRAFLILPYSDPRTRSAGLTIAVPPDKFGNFVRDLPGHIWNRGN